VEFALVSGAFITFVFGVINLGIITYTNAGVHWAVERASRLATISNTATQSDINTSVNNYLSSLGIASATVSYTVAAGTPPIAHIGATLSRSYSIPFVPTLTINYAADTYVPLGS